MLARIPATAAPEQELKFQLGIGALEALAETFPLDSAEISELHAVYFDTPGHALRDGGFSLRVRRSGATYIQTLKHRAGGGLFERDEWETEVPGPDLDLGLLSGTPAEAVLGDAAAAAMFTVDVTRRVHNWTDGDTRIEVCFDTGVIAAGDRREAVNEMELERVEGPPEALFALARTLQQQAALTLSFESKAERGYRLAGHDGVAALKAQTLAIGPDTDAATGFQMVMRDGLVQVAGNANLLQRAHNPEILHQTRVGLRRLRAALVVFKAMLDGPGLKAAREETRWLAGELSPARDIDVFLLNAATPDEIDESPGRAALFRALRIAQAEAYERALAAVRSGRFGALLLSLGEWIEVGAWRGLDDPTHRRLREGLATAVAAPVMDRLDHRLRKRSRRFMSLDPPARHELRKQAKKLRYAAAFFGEAFADHPKRRTRFVTNLRALQDRLGELNDMAVARGVAMQAVRKRSGELAFAAGLEVARLTRDEAGVLEAANKALKAYRRGRLFWSARNKDLNLSSPCLRGI